MKRFNTVEDVRALTAVWREAGNTIALVPTMGNLHRGHMKLVERAAEHAEHVIVSVFVNPTQFGPAEDFADYPRTLEVDARRLARAGIDVLFAPSVEAIYPHGIEQAARVSVPGLADILEGAERPGHFDGVASVVNRLFNICNPDIAVFGQKDYQQLVLLRRMVADLHMPVRLISAPTEREKNGLAMSSRNGYLDDAQRDQAGCIYSALTRVGEALAAGDREFAALEGRACDELRAAGLEPDYLSVRRADDLAEPGAKDLRLVVVAAARLGGVRLIDNIRIDVAR